MWWILSILLLVVPSIEIWVLMQLTYFMPLSTIFLQCIVTMAAGVWLMRGENFSLWTLVESELRNRRVPTEEVVIFIPVVREESISWLRKRVQKSLGQLPLN